MRYAILALLLVGCARWKVRPFGEAELYEHNGYNQVSGVAAGASFVSPGGAVVDIGPAMRFDFLGGRTEEVFDNQVVGGVVRLHWGN